jgi:hypothetical protein
MTTKKKVDVELPPAQRLYQKVAALGDDAPLELEEVCAFWNLGITSVEKIVAELPVADPLPRVRRWRYGDIRKQFVDMVTEKAS